MITHSKPYITEADKRAVAGVLTSGMLAQGELVAEFERRVAEYTGLSGGVAAASGTAALTLALKALNVGSSDEVILPTYACRSIMQAVLSAGAKPVLCDIGDDWNMKPATVAERISPRTRAIIVVHIFGIPADTRSFQQFGVPVIEDCCQAFGAREHGRRVGAWGDIAMFSFHATKCLATGEGGMIAASKPALLEYMRVLRDGDDHSRMRDRVASPLTDLQAALGLSQLARYDSFLLRRKAIAEIYFEELKNCPINLPENVRARSIFFRFPVLTGGDFDRQRAQFSALGVHVRRGVDQLLHRLMREDAGDYPSAERTFKATVSLPLYPALSDVEVDQIVAACRAVWN